MDNLLNSYQCLVERLRSAFLKALQLITFQLRLVDTLPANHIATSLALDGIENDAIAEHANIIAESIRVQRTTIHILSDVHNTRLQHSIFFLFPLLFEECLGLIYDHLFGVNEVLELLLVTIKVLKLFKVAVKLLIASEGVADLG